SSSAGAQGRLPTSEWGKTVLAERRRPRIIRRFCGASPMPKAAFVACLLCLPLAGCAAKQRKTCCLVAGAVGLAALIGLADASIDSALYPEPANTDTAEGQRKHWEWEHRNDGKDVMV